MNDILLSWHHSSKRVEKIASPHNLRMHDYFVDQVVSLSHQLIALNLLLLVLSCHLVLFSLHICILLSEVQLLILGKVLKQQLQLLIICNHWLLLAFLVSRCSSILILIFLSLFLVLF